MQEIESSADLDGRDALVVARTVAGDTPTAIAAGLGVSVHTVYRRLKQPHVRIALAEARAAEVRPLVAQAVGEAQKSVERLVAVRDGETTRDGDRIRAACALLTWFKDMYELSEVMPRLAALEAQLTMRAPDGREAYVPPNENHSHHCGAVPTGLVEDDTELA